jgi:hypothetical protein
LRPGGEIARFDSLDYLFMLGRIELGVDVDPNWNPAASTSQLRWKSIAEEAMLVFFVFAGVFMGTFVPLGCAQSW